MVTDYQRRKPKDCSPRALLLFGFRTQEIHGRKALMHCSISTQSASRCQADMLSQLIRWAKSLQIKPQLKALVRSLIDYWNISKSSPFPSIRRLAAELCVSRQTVHKYLNQLELAGIIARKRRYRDDGGKTSNVYRLLHGLHGMSTQVYNKR